MARGTGGGMICVLVGPPGSGKGTQAELITAALGVPHVSTGELLRAEADAGTGAGALVAPLLAAGELVPDQLIEDVVAQRLDRADAARGCILDGFPRTLHQARSLEARLRRAGRAIDLVLVLQVPEAVLTARLLQRAGEQHRSDDNPGSIRERLAEYHQLTEPVLDHFRSRGIPVLELDAAADVGTVHDRVAGAIAWARAAGGRGPDGALKRARAV